jgi:hypothetical protein
VLCVSSGNIFSKVLATFSKNANRCHSFFGNGNTISISSNIPVEYDDYPLDFRETLVPGGLRIVPTETATTPNVEYYFDDLPNHTVIDVCRTAYEKMVEIVEEAETQYAVRL